MSYDGRNRCVSRTVNGTTTFLFYESWNLVEERDGSGTQTARYIHGFRIDEMIAQTVATQTSYHHRDALGSTTHLTDSTGSVVERYSYDAFGAPRILTPDNRVVASSFASNRFLFTGREWVAGLEIYDYRNRLYSHASGRFLQSDPIRFRANDINIYRYVANNPVVHVDPTGEAVQVCLWFGFHAFIKSDRCGNWGFGPDLVAWWENFPWILPVPGVVASHPDLPYTGCVDVPGMQSGPAAECRERKLCLAMSRSAASPPDYTVTYNCVTWVADMLASAFLN
jgi:RHS repeat-associated protein